MARILLLLDSGGDQRLLAGFLRKHHEVIQADGELDVSTAIDAESDMAIVGWIALQRIWQALGAKRQKTLPVLWPVLLVASPDCIGQIEPHLWDCIDELIVTPIRQTELQTRITVLLRSQQLSVELSEANQRLRDRNTQLEELNRLKSQFVSMVSHEFSNPLGVISGYVQMLQNKSQPLPAEQQQMFLTRIQASIKRLTALVSDVLIMGRVGVGKLSYEPAPTDLLAFCRQLVSEIKFSSPTPADLVFEVASDCEQWCEANTGKVCVDEKLLRQILTNLLTNAIKYSPETTPVLFRLTCDTQQITFQVQDKGIGIPENYQTHLFEPFQRADNVGDISGTGLGLAITQQCVELHGGKIRCESQVELGTTFIVTIPS